MKCSHTTCHEDAIERVTITQEDVVAEKYRMPSPENPLAGSLVPTPGIWAYCGKHADVIRSNPLLEYIWSKFTNERTGNKTE